MLRKILKYFLYLIAAYAVVGFLIIPLLVKSQLVKILQQQTSAKVVLNAVYFNPFLFKLTLSGLKMHDIDDKPLVSFDSLVVDVDPSALLYGALSLHKLELNAPYVYVVHNKDKSLNLLNILKPSEKKEDTSSKRSNPLPRIIIDNIQINSGRVILSDYTLKDPFYFGVHNIGLRLKNVDTKENKNAKATVRFYASFEDDGFLDIHTKIDHYMPFASSGRLDFKANKLYTEWRYVKEMLNLEVADGRFSVHTEYAFDMRDINATKISNAELHIDGLRIKPKKGADDILTMKHFVLRDINALPLHSQADVGSVLVDGANVNVKRSASNTIDWLEYVKINQKPKSVTKQVEKNTQKKIPFALFIKNIRLENSNVSFEDDALIKPTTNSLNDITLQLHDINSSKGSWLRYSAALSINHKGKVTADGKLRAAPLTQNGSFDIEDISLKEITPYLQEKSYLALDDGHLWAKGVTEYEKRAKKPDLRLQGSLKLGSLFLQNKKEDALLFSLNSLTLKEYTLELFPSRLYVNSIDVNSFYVDAEIDKNRVLNFSKLMKENTSNKQTAKKDEKKKMKKGEEFPLKIDKITVSLGSAKFQDYSIPIKFKTDIHNLNGVIYSVSNIKGEHTLINLHGDIDKYGSTKIEGSLDAMNPKKFTDISMDFKNLDLSAMSGYSAEFAGYEIDSGKLFLDLGYNIMNSKLKATNKVVIKKIELGDEVEDENVTHLPLGFVVGLLEDDKGVIDIDMPIDGDVDKPDFKYGKLVWNTFTNLITRAVTAPFKFLGSMLGIDTEDLEYVAFESGSSTITPMQREKLDKLAMIMKKRPKLLLKVDNVYAKRSDTKALQEEKLISLVLEKSGLKNKEEHQSAMTLSMLEEIYLENAEKKSLQKLQAKVKEQTKENEEDFALIYRKQLIGACTAMMKVSEQDLVKLAKKRSNNLINYLINEKKIQAIRVQKTAKITQVSSENGFVNLVLHLDVAQK